MSKENDDKYPPGCRVFVGNIDTTCTKREVQELFEPFGKVFEEIRFHRGYGFIQYDNEESAKKAVEAMNGYKLRSKNLDVQLAHGQGAKSSTAAAVKRGRGKDEEVDDENTSKRKRQDDSSRTSEKGRRRDRTSQNIVDVPIFVTQNSLNDYAQNVKNMLESPQNNSLLKIKCHIINLSRDAENYLKTSQFLNRIQGDRYVIVIQKRNEVDKTVAFRAILPDGSSPGFADTPIQDVIAYILQNASTLVPLNQTIQQPYVSVDDRFSASHYQPTAVPSAAGYPPQYDHQVSSFASYDPSASLHAGRSAIATVLTAALNALNSATPQEKVILDQVINILRQGTVVTTAPTVSSSNYYDNTFSSNAAVYPPVDRAYSPASYNPSGGIYGQDYSNYPRYDSSLNNPSSGIPGAAANGTSSSLGSLLNSLSNIIKK
jgi:hypothetical protein